MSGDRVRIQQSKIALDRRSFIGGSDARIIMGKDEKSLLRLWKQKRGEVDDVDLSGELIVQLGLVTEDLNRRWYERNAHCTIIGVQRRVVHRSIPYMAATLDGLVKETGAVFEAKFMLPWSFSEEAAAVDSQPSPTTVIPNVEFTGHMEPYATAADVDILGKACTSEVI